MCVFYGYVDLLVAQVRIYLRRLWSIFGVQKWEYSCKNFWISQAVDMLLDDVVSDTKLDVSFVQAKVILFPRDSMGKSFMFVSLCRCVC
jgi:hypothetical protein